ncbi:MAG: NrsF family protein [Polyangiales bacterium]
MSACDDVTRALSDGAPLDGALREHARACPSCAALARAGAAPASRAEERMPDALRAAIAADAGAVEPFSPWRAAAAPSALTALLLVFALVRAPRRDLSGQLGAAFALAASTFAGLAALGLAAVVHRGARGLGPTTAQRIAYASLALPLFAAVTLATTRAVPGSVIPVGDDVARAFVHCAALGSAAAALVGAGLFAAVRRTSPVAPALAGAVAGVASGLAGALFLHLACPVALASHGVLAHGTPAVLGGVVGALLGRRLLAP